MESRSRDGLPAKGLLGGGYVVPKPRIVVVAVALPNRSFFKSVLIIVKLGIVPWSNQVQRLLDDGRLLFDQTRTQDITGPITVLLEGSCNVDL